LALLERAKADIPRIEQLERDHPRMARLFQKGLLPFGVWEQLLEAETMMDQEVNSVQAEAERLQKGWGAGVFSQAYQMLRKERDDELRAEAAARDAAVLTISFTKLSGGVVSLTADGRKVTQQTQLVIRKESATEEVCPPRPRPRIARTARTASKPCGRTASTPHRQRRRVCGALCTLTLPATPYAYRLPPCLPANRPFRSDTIRTDRLQVRALCTLTLPATPMPTGYPYAYPHRSPSSQM